MRKIADRKRELKIFDDMLTGKSPERIFLISAPSESGKSVLLAELANHGEGLLGKETCARVNLKAQPPLHTVLERICVALGRGSFPRFCGSGTTAPINIRADFAGAKFRDDNVTTIAPIIQQAAPPSPSTLASSLIADLSVRTGPAVVIIDTYEGATAETADWIMQQLLPMVRHIPRFWVVMAGKQNVPRPDDYRSDWGDLANFHELPPVASADDWHEYACQRYPGFPRERIEVICEGLASRPSAIEEFIRVTGSRLSNLKI